MKLLNFDVIKLDATKFILTQVKTLYAGIGSNVELSQPIVSQSELFEVGVVAMLKICNPVVTQLCTLQVCQVGYVD